jgi:hypothetical protein
MRQNVKIIINVCVQTNHMKKEVVIVFAATQTE